MPVVMTEANRFENRFEREIFETLCRDLDHEPEPYTVLGPLYLESGGEIDGLLTTPRCVFTIEAKNFNGRIHMEHRNAPLRAYDENGRSIDLSNRHKDTFAQAASQWYGVRDDITECFGSHNVFVKPLLVFPTGTLLSVPAELRDPTNLQAQAYILTADEVAAFAAKYQPYKKAALNALTQTAIARCVAGMGQITPAEQRQVAAAIALPLKQERVVSTTAQTEQITVPVTGPTQPTTQSSAVHRPSSAPTQQSSGFLPLAVRILVFGVLAALAYFSLNLLLSPLISGGVALLIFLFFWSGHWGWAIYTYLGGIMFALTSELMDLSITVSTLSAIFWPLALLLGGYLLVVGGNLFDMVPNNLPLPFFEDIVPTTVPAAPETAVPINNTATPVPPQPTATPEVVDESPPTEEATPAPESTTTEELLPLETAAKQVLIQGNSNVRAGPTTEDDVIGVALDGQIFAVVEESADGTWYKIELETGRFGWIGSSRVQETTP